MSDMEERLDVLVSDEPQAEQAEQADTHCGTGRCGGRKEDSLASLATILSNALQNEQLRNLDLRLDSAEEALSQLVDAHNSAADARARRTSNAVPFPQPFPAKPTDHGPVYVRVTPLMSENAIEIVRIETMVGCVDIRLRDVQTVQIRRRSENDLETRVTLGSTSYGTRLLASPEDADYAAHKQYLEQQLSAYTELLNLWHMYNGVSRMSQPPALSTSPGGATPTVDEAVSIQEDLAAADDAG